jgi:hypothetical protein
MTLRLDEETFFETYRVKHNPFAGDPPEDLDISSCGFETYGEELEHVRAQDPHVVWTLVEEDGAELIVAGMRTVNRLMYLITEVPWTDGDTVVTLD